MSHRDDCPDRWEARREGERAQERGYGSFRNPYEPDMWGEHGCEEAAKEWRSGYYAAERREEERIEEERWERARARARQEERDYEEQCIYESERYYAETEPEPSDEEQR